MLGVEELAVNHGPPELVGKHECFKPLLAYPNDPAESSVFIQATVISHSVLNPYLFSPSLSFHYSAFSIVPGT